MQLYNMPADISVRVTLGSTKLVLHVDLQIYIYDLRLIVFLYDFFFLVYFHVRSQENHVELFLHSLLLFTYKQSIPRLKQLSV